MKSTHKDSHRPENSADKKLGKIQGDKSTGIKSFGANKKTDKNMASRPNKAQK